ncbi:MAG: hypothetical protein ACE5J5_00730 [Candidatus Hydrothermarchaeales archaeon]
MFKKIAKVLFLILLLLGAFGVYTYFAMVKPLMSLEVEPQNIEMRSLDPLEFSLAVNVKNNGGGDATLPGATLNLYVENIYVGTGVVKPTTVPAGNLKVVNARIAVSQDIIRLTKLLSSRTAVNAQIDGTLHAKILFLSLNIPVPKVPVPVPIDTSELAQATQIASILPLLQEHKGESIAEVLESDDVLKEIEEKTGKEVTPEEAKELAGQYLGEEAIEDMTVDEALQKYKEGGGDLSKYAGMVP